MNKVKIYWLLSLLPLLFGAIFIALSEDKLYQKLPFKDYINGPTESIRKVLSGMPFRLGLDLSSGIRLNYLADTSRIADSEKSSSLEILRDVIERRVNAYGVGEPVVQTETSLSGENRLLVELPGLTDVQAAIKMIGETPTLEFKLERATGTERDAILAAHQAYLQSIASGTKPSLSPLLSEDPNFVSIGLDGKYLKKSQLVFDQTTGQPMISIEWDDTGAALFASTTKNFTGKLLGIFLDGQLVSAPRINEEIKDGKAIISGSFSRAEAKTLAGRLKTGALPINIKLAGSEVIEPILGKEALAAGLTASMYGFLFIILLLIFWYRIPGVVATVSLLSYVAIVLSIFKLIPVTLSAAGIAGFIISIGLAVDGNILTFERLKEELRKGKNLQDALVEAFGRSWTSIRDSNIASFIAALILFFIGTSVVKGFALTLMIGVSVSFFTNIVITRNLLRFLVSYKQVAKYKSLFTSLF